MAGLVGSGDLADRTQEEWGPFPLIQSRGESRAGVGL